MCPVVWVQHSGDELPVGSDGWQYVPELKQEESEPVVAKRYPDAFEDTDLEAVLAERRVGHLVVAGAQTDECIRATLHGAVVRGYDATLVGDAHTTEDHTQWGAPSPDKVVDHTNLYWHYHTAPGRRAQTVTTRLGRPRRRPLTSTDVGHEREQSLAMGYVIDPRVDAYIDALPDWQQAVCREVRELVHAADAEVVETIKRKVQPYFILQGNICALLAAKDHVNVFLYDGAIVPDPEGIITAGHTNSTARTVGIREGDTVNAAALTAMFRQIIANNRAGGWRKLKSAP